MFKRVLIPLDGSSRAELILGQLKPLLERDRSDLLLLRGVYDPPSLVKIDTGKLLRADAAEAEAYLGQVVHRLERDGLRARAIVKKESAEEAILQATREQNIDLIAMTTHGYSGAERWILGSVTEKVLRAAEVPLLVIHSFKRTPSGASVPLAGESVSFKSILVPIDAGDQSLAVLPWVERLAKTYQSEIVLVHVRPEPEDTRSAADPPKLAPPVPLTLKIAEDRLVAAGLRVRSVTVTGDPARRLLEMSGTGGFDLLAMATHGRSGLRRWVLGSIAEKILRASPIPMLVVPAKAFQPLN
jgi:nucleotide-binding universal stress UspA family protein